jgi:hypothetical protein
MPLNQTITVINKSGKVVNSSKHLVSVWREAKAAYLSRKAEISAKQARKDEAQMRRAINRISLSDEHLPRAESSRSVRRSKTTARRRDGQPTHQDSQRRSIPGMERGYSDSVYANDIQYRNLEDPSPRNRHLAPAQQQFVRRHTTPLDRPTSSESFDEHLAYGDMPPLPARSSKQEAELRDKMTFLNRFLDEADCLQYSATSTIEHLQKNPDALAAVGLTLAEISTLLAKLGPPALAGLKTAFPAVMALLAAPEFLIAGGVAVGVTVVMLGGYKIIKQIKGKKTALKEGDDVTELRELEGDLSRIEMWRRGIADEESRSMGTTVDGEFITPQASRRLMEEGVLMPEQVVRPDARRSRSDAGTRRHRRTMSEGGGTQMSGSRRHGGQAGAPRLRRAESTKSASVVSSRTGGKRKKAVSGLKMLFQSKRKPVMA